MRSLLALVVAGVALLGASTVHAQAPTVLSADIDAGQTINQLLVSGLNYTVTSNGPVEFTARLTTKVDGRTLLVSKSLRTESNAGQTGEPVRYSLVSATGNAAKALRKLKRARVTLTVDVKGADGFQKVLTTSATLPRGL